MYAPFFGLQQEPFSIAPDPRYLFMSDRHREALAHLLYGVNGGGGFVLLTGEIGAGKTTVCRCFLEQIPRRCNVAYIFNPKLTVIELLQSICEEFHVPVPPIERAGQTVKAYVDPLNEFLLKTHAVGQNNVLIIDEAQNLSADVLEQLRLLTNLETSERKLLQIILIGQPELREMVARPELEQLAQRVIARYHLGPLSEEETVRYVRHRLGVAGLTMPLPFSARALRHVHSRSGGVPRRINLLCDRALLGAYANGATKVESNVVDRAAQEVFGEPVGAMSRGGWRWPTAFAAGAAALGVAGLVAMTRGAPPRPVASATLPASAASASTSASMTASMAASTAAASAPARAQPAASARPVATVDVTTALPDLLPDERSAWRELGAAWQLAPGEGDPCLQAQKQQLQCYRATLSLAVVRQLDRPGIVSLHGERQRVGYALLTGLGADTATLQVEGVARSVPLAVLARAWRGEFATLWKAPPGFPAKASEAAAGPLVDWLNAQLQPPRVGSEGTVADLKSRVYAFQVAQGLRPDGIAGPTTFMQLNRALGIAEPHLKPAAQP